MAGKYNSEGNSFFFFYKKIGKRAWTTALGRAVYGNHSRKEFSLLVNSSGLCTVIPAAS
jgi:hypothetical protein